MTNHLKSHTSLAEMVSTHIAAFREALKCIRGDVLEVVNGDYWQHELSALADIENACAIEAARATAEHIGEATEKVSATADHRDSAELRAVKNAGAQMANIFFNLAQRPGEPLGAEMCKVLDTCRKEWDEAIRALKSQQDGAIESKPVEQSRSSAWISHWSGSYPYKGWSIRAGREEIVWLGDDISSEDLEAIVLAHNKCFDCDGAIRVMPSKETKCIAHNGVGANDPQDCDWPVCGCDPHANKVIASLEESGHLIQDRWQPIETAPKTGRTLLLGYPNSLGNWRTVRGQWLSQESIEQNWEEPDDAEAGWYETSVEADDVPSCWPITPTHWQPLPKPPADAAIESQRSGDGS